MPMDLFDNDDIFELFLDLATRDCLRSINCEESCGGAKGNYNPDSRHICIREGMSYSETGITMREELEHASELCGKRMTECDKCIKEELRAKYCSTMGSMSYDDAWTEAYLSCAKIKYDGKRICAPSSREMFYDLGKIWWKGFGPKDCFVRPSKDCK